MVFDVENCLTGEAVRNICVGELVAVNKVSRFIIFELVGRILLCLTAAFNWFKIALMWYLSERIFTVLLKFNTLLIFM